MNRKLIVIILASVVLLACGSGDKSPPVMPEPIVAHDYVAMAKCLVDQRNWFYINMRDHMSVMDYRSELAVAYAQTVCEWAVEATNTISQEE